MTTGTNYSVYTPLLTIINTTREEAITTWRNTPKWLAITVVKDGVTVYDRKDTPDNNGCMGHAHDSGQCGCVHCTPKIDNTFSMSRKDYYALISNPKNRVRPV